MKVWYIHTLAPWAHERNNYRWRAIEKHCRDNGFDFRLWNLFHKGQHRRLERENHSADVTFVCDFETADKLIQSRLDPKRMGFVAHITGAGWRRTAWINKALRTTATLKPNVVFLSHQVHLKRFNEICNQTFYVGLGFDPNVFNPTPDGKPGLFKGTSRDIVFCGNPAMGRQRRLELLAKELGPRRIEWRQGLSHADMAEFLRSGTIGWNQIGKGPEDGVSCNLRVYEVLGCGLMLLCSRSKHLDFLESGKHAVFWKNDRDLLDKASYYLRNDDKRERIARQGYEEAIKRHTWQNRAQEYMEIIRTFL